MTMPRLLLAAAVLTLPALPAAAQAVSSATYVAKAGAGDLYEKTSSKLVLASTRNAGLRDFATMMVRDHTKSTMDVKRAAMRSHVPARAPRLAPKQAKMIADLRAARGPARDALYVRQQKMAHADALALQRDYAQAGKAPALREVAAGIVPVVQHHIGMLQSM